MHQNASENLIFHAKWIINQHLLTLSVKNEQYPVISIDMQNRSNCIVFQELFSFLQITLLNKIILKIFYFFKTAWEWLSANNKAFVKNPPSRICVSLWEDKNAWRTYEKILLNIKEIKKNFNFEVILVVDGLPSCNRQIGSIFKS